MYQIILADGTKKETVNSLETAKYYAYACLSLYGDCKIVDADTQKVVCYCER